jgi:hypothetical protein
MRPSEKLVHTQDEERAIEQEQGDRSTVQTAEVERLVDSNPQGATDLHEAEKNQDQSVSAGAEVHGP